MRVAGIRADGAVWLNLDGGMAVILNENRCSPPVDPLACEKLGPWDDAHGISGSDRRELQQRLDRARTVPFATFLLEHRSVKVHTTHGKKKYKFEYSVSGPDDTPKKEQVIGDQPTEPSDEADTADADAPDATDEIPGTEPVVVTKKKDAGAS